MPEYTEIACNTHESANALHAYFLSEMRDDNESVPQMRATVEGKNLRVTYDRDDEPQRSEWDKQLIGFRDGFELCQAFYNVPFDDSGRRAKADQQAIDFVNNALGINEAKAFRDL